MYKWTSLILLSALSTATYAQSAKVGSQEFFIGGGNQEYDLKDYSTPFDTSSYSLHLGWGKKYHEHIIAQGYARFVNAEDDVFEYKLRTSNFGGAVHLTTNELGDTPFELYTKGAVGFTFYNGELSGVDFDDNGFQLDVGVGAQWNIEKSDYWVRAEYLYGVVTPEIDGLDAEFDGFTISIGKHF